MARLQFAIIALSAFLSNSALSAVEASPGGAAQPANLYSAADAAGWLGVLLDSGAERPTVAEVIPGSPAESAGLRAGDVFLAVGDDKVSSIDDLQRLLGGEAVGSEVVLQVERDGDRIAVEVRLGERPAEGQAPQRPTTPLPAAEPKAPPPKPAATETGRLQRETPPSRQDPKQAATGRAYLGVSVAETAAGVRVERVVEDSPAAQAGLRSGDLLRAVNGRKVGDLDDLDRAMGKLKPGQEVRIDITRGERNRDLKVRMGEAGGAAAIKPTEKPDKVTKPLPVKVKKIGRSEPSVSARIDQDIKAAQERAVEADMRRARAAMEKERANMQSELEQARRQMAEARSEVASEIERVRRDFERDRERAQNEMNAERQAFEKEMQGARKAAEEELGRWRRDMERERKAMDAELQRAQKESEQQMRRANREMDEQRQQMERELRRDRSRAEDEMQRMQRDLEKERQELEEQLQSSRKEAEKEIRRQQVRVEDELKRARDAMNAERRRMHQPEPRRQPGSRRESGGAQTSDLEKRLVGMRREFDRIRAELQELKTLLEKKRR